MSENNNNGFYNVDDENSSTIEVKNTKTKAKKKSLFSFKKKAKKQDETTNIDPAKAKQYKKYQKKKKLRKVANTIMGFIIFCGLLGCFSGYSIIKTVIDKTDVILETEDLASKDSSIIYDDSGNVIRTLGSESRVSYSYNKMPQALIDAFVAIEDSRHFEHSGFDIPRFAKALLENIKSFSFGQGGSTITMQVIKNTYFAVDTIAEKSIGRKIQEIYFSLKITGEVSKEKIIEMYINKVNYGYTTRGAQTAANYYFNKNINELSLVECAMLAGIINLPNAYNPYVDLNACQARTNDVLYQMYNHGYISLEEYKLAEKVKIENLLSDNSSQYSNKDGTYIDNQAYIDIVLDEIEEVYGIDPYETPVKIYTAMNQKVQAACDDVAKGNVIVFQDDNINCAASVVQNYTGLIVGVCGGRYYNAERIFSYAKDARTSPGSTSKAILTYPLAFEYCGMATSHTLTDEPIAWAYTDIVVANDDFTYHGQVTVQRAFPLSYNIPSILLYRWIQECAGNRSITQYLRTLEFDDYVINNLNEQYAIGCNGFDVSVIQMSAAESMLLSQGLYTSPHTITKIEYINGNKEPIYADYSSTRALSAEACWLATYLQKVGVNGYGTANDFVWNTRLANIGRSDCTVYGKTGTNGYDYEVIKQWGYPITAAKDMYYVFGTNDYSFAFWQGYDTGRYQDETTYISTQYAHSNPDVAVCRALVQSTIDAYGLPANTNAMPSGISTIVHIDGYYPYTINPEYSHANTIAGFIKTEAAALNEWVDPENIYSVQEFSGEYDAEQGILYYNIDPYPDSDALEYTPNPYPIYSYDGTTKVNDGRLRFSDEMVNGAIRYHVDICNKNGEILYGFDTKVNEDTVYVDLNDVKYKNGDTVYLHAYYVYEYCRVRSAYVEIKVKAKHTTRIPTVQPSTDNDVQ